MDTVKTPAQLRMVEETFYNYTSADELRVEMGLPPSLCSTIYNYWKLKRRVRRERGGEREGGREGERERERERERGRAYSTKQGYYMHLYLIRNPNCP